MRIETTAQSVPQYAATSLFDELIGDYVYEQTGENIEVISITLLADDGKRFKRVSDGTLLGNVITLGTEDGAENYIEVQDNE